MLISGTHAIPGDKSLTHRALLLASLARGESVIHGALTSLDAKSTARLLRAVGTGVGPLTTPTPLRVLGRAWRRPAAALHCGNSGTTVRLGLGLMAGRRFSATFTGDRSLRRRPMRRLWELLERMGADIRAEGRMGGCADDKRDGLPVTITGGKLKAVSVQLPASSAQIKGALLLAGVVGGVEVSVLEPNGLSRDHTERMLRQFGYLVGSVGSDGTDRADGTGGTDRSDRSDGTDGTDGSDGVWVRFSPTGSIVPFEFRVPGDISSAAFLLGAAILADGGEILLRDVGVNPTRDGFLHVIARMGAVVSRENSREWQGEPVADLVARPARLRATTVDPGHIPGLIDEIPMLAVLASRAEGTTRFREVGELRVKESDRLILIAENLQRLGVEAEVQGNDLWVTGTDRPPRGRVETGGDHRIAMAFGVLATVKGAKVRVDDMECAAVSFPGFAHALRGLRR